MINIRSVETRPKILIWDVETSYMLLRGYDLYPKSPFSVDAIEKDWIMLGAAWKWLGEERVKSISVSPRCPENDYEVISILHTVLSEAEILVGHNSDSFDLKKFNARAIVHGFHPISPKKSVDTLKIARKYFKFTSNKLRYIASKLGVEEKDESPDWSKCVAGDSEALRYMRQYNRQDVITTEQVYLKLAPYHYTHPVQHKIRDVSGNTVHTCPNCHSPNLHCEKPVYRKNGNLAGYLYQCLDCGRWNQK